MVQRRGDDALCPQPPGAQLVHSEAGGYGVFAGPDPVVGSRGHDDPDPAGTARCAARDLPAYVRHGEQPCVFTKKKITGKEENYIYAPDTRLTKELTLTSSNNISRTLQLYILKKLKRINVPAPSR